MNMNGSTENEYVVNVVKHKKNKEDVLCQSLEKKKTEWIKPIAIGYIKLNLRTLEKKLIIF